MLDDYELEPFTVRALAMFRDGNDPSRGEAWIDRATSAMSEEIADLDDFTKGVVIIDLLTLCDALQQAISIMQVDGIEKGMTE